MAPMAVMSPKPAARTSKKKPAKSQQSQCLPIRYGMQSKSRRHDPVPQVQNRLTDEDNVRFLSKVFWFSLEFGVVVEDGVLRAYGAGILSSYGEIEEFRGMEHRRLDLSEMGTADYDITAYQPVLYRAESIDEIVEVVGGFFATCTDDSISAMLAAERYARARPGTPALQ